MIVRYNGYSVLDLDIHAKLEKISEVTNRTVKREARVAASGRRV